MEGDESTVVVTIQVGSPVGEAFPDLVGRTAIVPKDKIDEVPKSFRVGEDEMLFPYYSEAF